MSGEIKRCEPTWVNASRIAFWVCSCPSLPKFLFFVSFMTTNMIGQEINLFFGNLILSFLNPRPVVIPNNDKLHQHFSKKKFFFMFDRQMGYNLWYQFDAIRRQIVNDWPKYGCRSELICTHTYTQKVYHLTYSFHCIPFGREARKKSKFSACFWSNWFPSMIFMHGIPRVHIVLGYFFFFQEKIVVPKMVYIFNPIVLNGLNILNL